MNVLKRVNKCCEYINSKIDFKPAVGLILGSGLGNLADSIDVKYTIPYNEIEGFPVSTAPNHKGRFVFGNIGAVPVVIMQGRVHYYEGYSMEEVVLPTRVMGRLGIKILFLTNVSGGVNKNYSVGDFMILKDHISFMVPSPLVGANIDEFGVRFPDMTQVYDKKLRKIIKSTAHLQQIDIKNGVYMQTSGPQFETPAEIKMCRNFGADAVGMSTVCEAIAAKHMGISVCAVSCIANMAAGIEKKELSGEDVNIAADMVGESFEKLIKSSIVNFGEVI